MPLSHRRKSGTAVGLTEFGKGTKILAIVDPHSLPLASTVKPVSLRESRLVESTLASGFLDESPEHPIRGCAYREPHELRPWGRTAAGSTTNWAGSSASRRSR